MRERHYLLLGEPIPLARPRMHKSNVWDPQKEHKLVAGLHVRQQHAEEPFFAGPIKLDLSFYIKKPHKGPNKNLYHHPFRPDLDNLIKFIADICTGILYDDDCIIASISAKKIYDDNPRTEFTVLELYAQNN